MRPPQWGVLWNPQCAGGLLHQLLFVPDQKRRWRRPEVRHQEEASSMRWDSCALLLWQQEPFFVFLFYYVCLWASPVYTAFFTSVTDLGDPPVEWAWPSHSFALCKTSNAQLRRLFIRTGRLPREGKLPSRCYPFKPVCGGLQRSRWLISITLVCKKAFLF